MLYDIFQIDWIFVDTIIIVLLFLLLIGVRIFKSTHRWRVAFSNEALEYYTFPDAHKTVGNHFFHSKKWSFVRDSSLKEKCSKKPLILVLRTNYKRRLLRILSEGLASNGFNIITVSIKFKNYPDSNILEKGLTDELTSLISSIINHFKETDLIKNLNYILLNHSKSFFPYKAIMTDSKNKGMILINPKINNKNLINFHNVIDNKLSNNPLYTIFSRKSRFILTNKNLKSLLNEFPSKLLTGLKIITLHKARNTFKYYETVVLGIIIDIVENKILKSKI
ncbi:MAG: hypothetical protein ACFE75_13785 [Candidatus Hodarchaeota archaeon]